MRGQSWEDKGEEKCVFVCVYMCVGVKVSQDDVSWQNPSFHSKKSV